VNRTTRAYLGAVILAACTLLGAIDENSSATNAVNLVRRINTEEQHKRRGGAFVPIPQFTEELRDALRAYDVHLTISSDGKQYAVLLSDRNARAVTFYSDERGLIYKAEPIQ
jgi:hypothetical protein